MAAVPRSKPRGSFSGFTLIELSIVLVIIGLIVGGVLVGRDLIKAAEVRSQLSQIEKLNQAVNAFRGKFAYLPGDIIVAEATRFGFTVGASCDGSVPGFRNGNGLIEGWNTGSLLIQGTGESALAWPDLSTSGLIGKKFPGGGGSAIQCVGNGALVLTLAAGTSYIGNHFPTAKLGTNNFIYISILIMV